MNAEEFLQLIIEYGNAREYSEQDEADALFEELEFHLFKYWPELGD